MTTNYYPEMGMSPELELSGITTYQELIGILRWSIEIGRIDVLTKLSMLSSYQAAPRQAHLEQIYHIFAFLKKNLSSHYTLINKNLTLIRNGLKGTLHKHLGSNIEMLKNRYLIPL